MLLSATSSRNLVRVERHLLGGDRGVRAVLRGKAYEYRGSWDKRRAI